MIISLVNMGPTLTLPWSDKRQQVYLLSFVGHSMYEVLSSSAVYLLAYQAEIFPPVSYIDCIFRQYVKFPYIMDRQKTVCKFTFFCQTIMNRQETVCQLTRFFYKKLFIRNLGLQRTKS